MKARGISARAFFTLGSFSCAFRELFQTAEFLRFLSCKIFKNRICLKVPRVQSGPWFHFVMMKMKRSGRCLEV